MTLPPSGHLTLPQKHVTSRESGVEDSKDGPTRPVGNSTVSNAGQVEMIRPPGSS